MQRAQDSPPQFDRSVFPFETVSVSGGTGTVGSQFVKVLLAQFPDVRRVNTTCRPDGPRTYRIPEADRVNVVKGGINHLEVLEAMAEGAEVVDHLAAWPFNTPLPEQENQLEQYKTVREEYRKRVSAVAAEGGG